MRAVARALTVLVPATTLAGLATAITATAAVAPAAGPACVMVTLSGAQNDVIGRCAGNFGATYCVNESSTVAVETVAEEVCVPDGVAARR